MITSIRMVNFKNFVDETLRLGPFTMVVGTNASGKSNIRDAFRFLHGIGRGYTLMEVVGGNGAWAINASGIRFVAPPWRLPVSLIPCLATYLRHLRSMSV
jgi:hypothetical protein